MPSSKVTRHASIASEPRTMSKYTLGGRFDQVLDLIFNTQNLPKYRIPTGSFGFDGLRIRLTCVDISKARLQGVQGKDCMEVFRDVCKNLCPPYHKGDPATARSTNLGDWYDREDPATSQPIIETMATQNNSLNRGQPMKQRQITQLKSIRPERNRKGLPMSVDLLDEDTLKEIRKWVQDVSPEIDWPDVSDEGCIEHMIEAMQNINIFAVDLGIRNPGAWAAEVVLEDGSRVYDTAVHRPNSMGDIIRINGQKQQSFRSQFGIDLKWLSASSSGEEDLKHTSKLLNIMYATSKPALSQKQVYEQQQQSARDRLVAQLLETTGLLADRKDNTKAEERAKTRSAGRRKGIPCLIVIGDDCNTSSAKAHTADFSSVVVHALIKKIRDLNLNAKVIRVRETFTSQACPDFNCRQWRYCIDEIPESNKVDRSTHRGRG